jgi:hypothetical protein
MLPEIDVMAARIFRGVDCSAARALSATSKRPEQQSKITLRTFNAPLFRGQIAVVFATVKQFLSRGGD